MEISGCRTMFALFIFIVLAIGESTSKKICKELKFRPRCPKPGASCQRCCPNCASEVAYCCPFGFTCTANHNGKCVLAEFTDDEEGEPCNRECGGNCNDGPKIWCRYGYTCSADDDTGRCKPIVPPRSTVTPTSTSALTQPASITATSLQASTPVLTSCTRCSADGKSPPAPQDCCPFSQTCDQPGSGTCISAKPSDEGGNYFPCLRVRANGDKIWCHFGTTCSAPDGTGVCKPLKGLTTAETTIDEKPTSTRQSISTESTLQSTSKTTVLPPISTTKKTQPASATTEPYQISTSVYSICKPCSEYGFSPDDPPNCCPYKTTCDQPAGGTCISAEPTEGGHNLPCQRASFLGAKIWCRFGTTCSDQFGSGVCVKLQRPSTMRATTDEAYSLTRQSISTALPFQSTSKTTLLPQSLTITTTQPILTTTEPAESSISVSSKCKKCSRKGILSGDPPNCCPFSKTCDQSDGGTCIAAEPSTEGNYPECLKVRANGDKIWCRFGTTCSKPDGTGVCVPIKGTTTVEASTNG